MPTGPVSDMLRWQTAVRTGLAHFSTIMHDVVWLKATSNAHDDPSAFAKADIVPFENKKYCSKPYLIGRNVSPISNTGTVATVAFSTQAPGPTSEDYLVLSGWLSSGEVAAVIVGPDHGHSDRRDLA